MFPQLRKIEQKYGDQVIVVGVHSPKFPAERDTANLREAVLRYRIEHPVVNDRDFAIWHRFAGRAWPTLMFIDPESRVIGKHEGELPFEQFDPLVAGMIKEFDERGMLRPADAAVPLEELREPARALSFPGKVLAADDALYIADSNHHQILVTDLAGKSVRRIGSGEPGLVDGGPHEARFQQPQGMAIGGNTLYVADTENHAIRQVELKTGNVTTLAGTGAQASTPASGSGPSVALSSPWDLSLADRVLYVAMAGIHQIWSLDLVTGIVGPFAGTGREGLLDGDLQESWFAQPSGLTHSNGRIYVADSEVSAIREIDLQSRKVRTLVGAGLFVFGDQDGAGDVVRLQHPLGLSANDGQLYLADSYNNKIKRVDPSTRRVSSWLGSGAAAALDGRGAAAAFREPGGVCAGRSGLFIADTNNHRIAFADWSSAEVTTLIGPGTPPDRAQK